MKKIVSIFLTIGMLLICSGSVFAGDIPESLMHSEEAQLFFGEVIAYHPDKENPDVEVSPVAVIKGDVQEGTKQIYYKPNPVGNIRLKEGKVYLFTYFDDVNPTDIFEVTTYDTRTLKLKNVEGAMWERFEKYLNEGKYGVAYIEDASLYPVGTDAAFIGLLLLEGIVMCFVLLIVCVVGIANGPVGLVVLYEDDVQQRVVELGYTTKEKIHRSFIITSIALFVPVFVLTPLMVYGINGANGFWDGFWQMTIVLWIAGLFDRFFIDRYWVGRTKAWIIPGTEDLKPYIPTKVLIRKWVGTIVGYPIFAALIAFVMELV